MLRYLQRGRTRLVFAVVFAVMIADGSEKNQLQKVRVDAKRVGYTAESDEIGLPYVAIWFSKAKKESETLVEQLLQDAIYTYIKELKRQKGLTATQLAEMANVSSSTLEKYLAGNAKNPSFAFICAVVKALGGSVDEAIGVASAKTSASAGIPNDLLIQMHEKEKEAWQQVISTQHDQIVRQSRHIRKLFGTIIGMLVMLFISFGAITYFLLDGANSSWGRWEPRVAQMYETIYDGRGLTKRWVA